MNGVEMFEEENKKEIIKALLPVVQLTRNGADVKDMKYRLYDTGEEIVEIRFICGAVKKVNVHMDSGTAMIRDVCKGLQ